ncbi:MAG TPA: hypothetical protein VFQ42_19130 [Mycobacterium sp.]|nr:hypothetical protein [Mycobacterium sp.]
MNTREHNRAIAAVAADLEAQALALDELCPVCAAEPGDRCVGQITHEPLPATHWQRIRQATRNAEGPVT